MTTGVHTKEDNRFWMGSSFLFSLVADFIFNPYARGAKCRDEAPKPQDYSPSLGVGGKMGPPQKMKIMSCLQGSLDLKTTIAFYCK